MKTGLVLEGGACRGVFPSGVLDVMQERGLTFDYCVGVSAGAGNAMCFKSAQKGRAMQLTAGLGAPSYYGIAQARTSKKLLDLELLYDRLSYEGPFPLDFSAYHRNPLACEYVLTCCETGQAAYFREDVNQHRLQRIVMASSSLPGFCPPVELDGLHYLDGGIVDPLPVHRATAQGCDRVVLVTTKPADNLHPMDYTKMRPLMAKLYKRRYPALYEALMRRVPHYFEEMEEILGMEAAGELLVIRPRRCEIRGLEKDRGKMAEYYRHGCAVAKEEWSKLEEYLG